MTIIAYHTKLVLIVTFLSVYNAVAVPSFKPNGLRVAAWNFTASLDRSLYRDSTHLFGDKNVYPTAQPSNTVPYVNLTNTNTSPPVVATAVTGNTDNPSATASASNSSGTSGGNLSDYAQPIVTQHNLHRANHSAPDIVWDDNLASIAATIAASCVYAHNTSADGGGYGQNIGAGAPPNQVDAMITNEMYDDEIICYPGYGGEPDMSNFACWGHFSQIVWKDTTKLGCATQYCPNGLINTGSSISPYFTVCNYEPAGNFRGQYGANVLAPLDDPTVVIPQGQ